MINGKSQLAASRLGDIFAKTGWARAGLQALATDKENEVAIQYHSAATGTLRVVTCDVYGLTRWLKKEATQPGARGRFESLLDRKDARPSAPRQTLLPLGELSPIARRSLLPD